MCREREKKDRTKKESCEIKHTWFVLLPCTNWVKNNNNFCVYVHLQSINISKVILRSIIQMLFIEVNRYIVHFPIENFLPSFVEKVMSYTWYYVYFIESDYIECKKGTQYKCKYVRHHQKEFKNVSFSSHFFRQEKKNIPCIRNEWHIHKRCCCYTLFFCSFFVHSF